MSSMLLLLAVSGNIYIAADQTTFKVTQSPEEAVVSKGGNVTFYCLLPISQDQSWTKVQWWKQGENNYQRTGIDIRKKSGLRADPNPLKIFAKWNSATTFIIVCETSAFYPKNFSLTWYKNGIEITLGVQTKVRKDTEGLYVVSSNLNEIQTVQNDTNYTCLVSHVSLNTSAVAVYSISKSNQGSSVKTLSPWVPRSAMGGLSFLLLTIAIGTQCRKQGSKGKEECLTEANQREVKSAIRV
ncbi:uncharacterized protein LOC132407141 isoform X4 [Hypanus sabinus]|uniref:uncharacterized protein LOC132407141 isoform X4 n=1 Tax=Hypanus sabinus TaxID=79690 RepID=UPI0028C3C412|nr:uncharacterized protein LOC132407141 isoform X4 [Hypanus sabinus]